MRAQVTRKNVLKQSKRVLKANYFIKGLMDEANIYTDFYTAGVYGWNADVYDLGDGCVLVTGQRSLFGSAEMSDNDMDRVCELVRSGAKAAEVRMLLHEIIEDTVPLFQPLD